MPSLQGSTPETGITPRSKGPRPKPASPLAPRVHARNRHHPRSEGVPPSIRREAPFLDAMDAQWGSSFPAPIKPFCINAYQVPVLGMSAQGAAGASGSPFCSSSTETPSGERTNAIHPSRGGRLMVTPPSINRWQVA